VINDRQITISAAGSRKATQWPQQTLYWSELVDRLKTPTRGTETLAVYLSMPKSRQDELKDVGGFVAGALTGARRKANSITGRDVITLDLDHIPAGGTNDTLCRLDALGCAYAVYSTRKHDSARPRLRVLIPVNRTATADEYEPLSRKLGGIIGMDLCDPTTFEASRLMYWPSCCADSQYVYQYGDKPFLDVDALLATYTDWRNVAEWPEVPGAPSHVKLAEKQGDPTAKQGVVGAFCRIYNVYQALDAFLPGVYEPCDDMPGRYTYTGGSTVGGAIVYDDGAFLYSHHATDPTGGRLVNSFDLVRLHRFADRDDEARPDTPTNKLPSYLAMCEMAVVDTHVAALLNQERYERATADFTDTPDENANWISKLAVSSTTGTPAKTIDNVLIILENDPRLKGKLAYDEFANRGLALGALPWDSRTERRIWGDPDDAGVLHHLEHVYNIQIADKRMYAAITLYAHRHKFNDVQEYLTSLQWDDVKRLDILLTDYLGAEDNVYTRAVIRKSLAAAVARAMRPGTKYDYVPILAGPQGLGKSTFLRLLGRQWYSDSLQTFDGKEASEMIQGVWINELGELNGLSRSETNAVKQFLSRTEDIFREPYGRHTDRYPRRCVFFGTTNDTEFLHDRTGNRRFWPVDVGVQPPNKSVFTELENEVDQIWAEAFVRWQSGEPLYLADEAEIISLQEQEAHKESNAKEGIIRGFVEHQIPANWDKRTLSERRLYWSGEFGRASAGETVERDRVCAAELWCECFGKDISFMRRTDVTEINGILDGLPGWKKDRNGRQFGKPYGLQRGYSKSSHSLNLVKNQAINFTKYGKSGGFDEIACKPHG
jgi:putative DNA primase/helicase